MEINILDYRLKVLSIKRESIAQCTHALIEIVFLQNRNGRNDHQSPHGFVSITGTNQDYSVVIEEEALKRLHVTQPNISVETDIWIPLVVSVGPIGSTASGISKIAKSVIGPLADFKVSVYCLSTYKHDYVMVKEKDLETACEVLAYDFRITREGSLHSQEVEVEPTRVRHRLEETSRLRPITHTFTSPPNKFFITSMDRESVASQALTLIELLFYSCNELPPEHEQFCSLTIVDQDISLVLDSNTQSMFPPDVLFNTSELWRMVKIGDMPAGLGFVQVGVVAQMSDPIAAAHISEYYISSYFYGHTLVPEEDIEEVLRLLELRRELSITNGVRHNETSSVGA